MMRPKKSSKVNSATQRAWEPPTVTKLAIGTQTKSGRDDGQKRRAQPKPPAAPTTKLGFAFEWAFPLSVRTEK
jgi:hypothetical protein